MARAMSARARRGERNPEPIALPAKPSSPPTTTANAGSSAPAMPAIGSTTSDAATATRPSPTPTQLRPTPAAAGAGRHGRAAPATPTAPHRRPRARGTRSRSRHRTARSRRAAPPRHPRWLRAGAAGPHRWSGVSARGSRPWRRRRCLRCASAPRSAAASMRCGAGDGTVRWLPLRAGPSYTVLPGRRTRNRPGTAIRRPSHRSGSTSLTSPPRPVATVRCSRREAGCHVPRNWSRNWPSCSDCPATAGTLHCGHCAVSRSTAPGPRHRSGLPTADAAARRGLPDRAPPGPR